MSETLSLDLGRIFRRLLGRLLGCRELQVREDGSRDEEGHLWVDVVGGAELADGGQQGGELGGCEGGGDEGLSGMAWS